MAGSIQLDSQLVRPSTPPLQGRGSSPSSGEPLRGTGQPARRATIADAGRSGIQEQISGQPARLLAVSHPPPRALPRAELESWAPSSAALARQFVSRPDGLPGGAPAASNLGGVSPLDIDRMKQIYNLRRGIVVTNEAPPPSRPVGQAQANLEQHPSIGARHTDVPDDPTEDPIEHKVVNAEMGVGAIEMGVMGFQQAVGKLSAAGQSSEAVGALFGMLPETIALFAQNRLAGQTREAMAAESSLKSKIIEQAHTLERLLAPYPLLQENAGAVDQRPHFEALRIRLEARSGEIGEDLTARLGKTIDLLQQLYDGQAVSESYLRDTLHEIRRDRIGTGVALAGGAIETGGAIAATVAELGEHSVPHIVGAAGYGAGAVGGALTLPFAAKFAIDNARSVKPHTEALALGNEKLDETGAEKAQSLKAVSRPGALGRALAKLAVRRSEPGTRKIKTGLFGLSIAASTTGIAGYAAAAAGATVAAGILSTVGMWIGIAALTGFTVYSIARYVSDRRTDGTFRTDALKKVITGEPNPISGPIKTRQTDKLMNRAFFASCEQFAHAAIDRATARPRAEEPPSFDERVAMPLREHAKALLDPGIFANSEARKLGDEQIDRMIANLKAGLRLDAQGRILSTKDGSNPETAWDDAGEGYARSIREAISSTLASTLREVNAARTVLVQNRAQFSSAFDRIDRGDGMFSSDYRITAENRMAVATVLAGFMPDGAAVESWGQTGPDALADPAQNPTELRKLIDDQAEELARAAALRKLLRRDPEALLLTFAQAMRDAYVAGDEGKASLDSLRDDLQAFGVTEATLDLVLKAVDDKQISDAAGLIAKELKFLS